MADDEQQEEGEKRPENPFLTRITTPETFTEVFNSADKLFCLVALSTQCPLCKAYEAALYEISMAQPEFDKVQFAYFNVEDCPSGAIQLKLNSVPSLALGMTGEVWEGFSGNNVEKMKGMVKNNQAKRNEKMKDFDKAKAEAAKIEAARLLAEGGKKEGEDE